MKIFSSVNGLVVVEILIGEDVYVGADGIAHPNSAAVVLEYDDDALPPVPLPPPYRGDREFKTEVIIRERVEFGRKNLERGREMVEQNR